MKYLFLFLGYFIFLISCYAGETIGYVSDSFWITLRTGPGTEYKIIAFLPSGEPLKIISSKGNWTKVKPLNPRYSDEGWVLTRFIMKRKPYKSMVDSLNKENLELKKQVFQLKKQLEERVSNEKLIQEKLEKITGLYKEIKDKYETLKRDSADYLDLKAKYEKNKIRLKEMEAEVERLKKENEYLKRSQAHRWFLMGAFVLFAGIILGLILGGRKRRPYYY